MQSDGNSFIGNVVLESFNIPYRDEESIFDQKYEKQIFCALDNKDRYLDIGRDYRKCTYKEI